MKLAIRVDVDTLRGTRMGVPSLCQVFDRHSIKAAFFFSVGPDNMGRHLWRLLKPKFLVKMLRTKAASLYGWDILLMGTAWPGLKIGKRCEPIIRNCAKAGHEIGVHAWDHHKWQSRIDTMDAPALEEQITKAFNELSRIIGRPPTCSAVPGWKAAERTLLIKAQFPFKYNSDCRGTSLFRPIVAGKTLAQPQLPVTLPTYDEMLGRNGVTNDNYNERLISLLKPDGINVLTIHAEAEGILCASMFEDFVNRCKAMGVEFVAPSSLIPEDIESIPAGRMVKGDFPGREGWLALQAKA
jgi:undecaprenyl phosphate-alpha-L-ara4FN deformylase